MKVMDLVNGNMDWKDSDQEIEIWTRNGHKIMEATVTEIKRSFVAQLKVMSFKSQERNYIMINAWASSERLENGEERITEITF